MAILSDQMETDNSMTGCRMGLTRTYISRIWEGMGMQPDLLQCMDSVGLYQQLRCFCETVKYHKIIAKLHAWDNQDIYIANRTDTFADGMTNLTYILNLMIVYRPMAPVLTAH